VSTRYNRVMNAVFVLSDRDHDLLNLAANAILSLLNDPGLSLDNIIRANYQPEGDDADSDAADTVRGWIA
jgi:hypothetical protein